MQGVDRELRWHRQLHSQIRAWSEGRPHGSLALQPGLCTRLKTRVISEDKTNCGKLDIKASLGP